MPQKKAPSNPSLNRRLQQTPVAIVGMSALFPEAEDLTRYWENILGEVDCLIEAPKDRFSIEDYYDANVKAPDKTFSKKGGFIPPTLFNPIEWGLPPNILEVTDVSQLLSLVMAKRVLEDAGYGEGKRDFDRSRTGCILGVGGGQKLMSPLVSRLQYPVWDKVLKSEGIGDSDRAHIIEKMKKAYIRWEEMSFPGSLGNVIAGRIANRLDLGSTNCVVDAACGSSLAGIRMALSDLLEYRSDAMITGGVDTDNSIYMYMCFSKTPAFTQKEVNQPFDKNSAGIMIGEGIGMLFLKRLEDAERDQDRIYAVIRGAGSSSDGKYKSIYAPRAEGQILALKRAYEVAGVDPKTLGLWEAHGTGTKAGDATEAKALRTFIGDSEKKTLALGSVKSQIAHTKNAAGAAGMIKVALALHHKVLPATINVTEPNPELGLEGSPVYLNGHTRPWIYQGVPRRGGVSAFGFGGTNFHFVLEEYTQNPGQPFRIHRGARALFLNAADRAGLIKKVNEQLTKLVGEQAPKVLWDWVKASRALKIKASDARLGLVAKDTNDAKKLLGLALTKLNESDAGFTLPEGVFFAPKAQAGEVAALFSGQGSPYLGMGLDLAHDFPPVGEAWAQMDRLFEDQPQSLSQIVFPIAAFTPEETQAQAAKLQLTENAQPAIGVFSMGQYKVFQNAGFKAQMAAGHSFGELTALWAAGVISEADFLLLAKERGQAMKAVPGKDAGSMMAVVGEIADIEAKLDQFEGVKAANFNSKKQVVLAGPKAALDEVAKVLKADGLTCKMLGVSAAFHTPMVAHAQKPFAKAIDKVKFSSPKIPVYSNASALPHAKEGAQIQKALAEHLLQSVRFTGEIEAMYKAGARVFVEFGPQSILTNLVSNILAGKEHVAVAINQNPKKPAAPQLLCAFTQLKVLGLDLGEIDPYAYDPEPSATKPNPMAVALTGANYVSAETRKTFQDALADGHRIAPLVATPAKVQANFVAPKPATAAVVAPHPEPSKPMPIATTPKAAPMTLSLAQPASLQNLKEFQAHQAETVKVHEQFLKNQTEYSKAFFGLMQNPAALQMVAQLEAFHQHQADTLRVHEQYLNHQADFANKSFAFYNNQPMPQAPAPLPAPVQVAPAYVAPVAPAYVPPAPIAPVYVAPAAPVAAKAPAPVAKPAAPSAPAGDVAAALMAVVAEKTGYAAEMLDLSMDLESDLGVDSIKRVEILYGVQEKMPSLGELNPDALAELRTLQEIVNHLGKGAVQVPTPAASGNPAAIEEALMAVVADKTGYAAEMLELSMDLESDLGVDSIKRVEILYALQERMPSVGEVNPDALSSLRTLKEIAHFISQGDKKKSPELAEIVGPGRLPVTVKALPAPDFLEAPPLAGHQLVLTSNPDAEALAKALKKQGWERVSILSLPGTQTGEVAVAELSEAAIAQAVQELRSIAPIAGFIHLHSYYQKDFDLAEAKTVQGVFFLAKFLKADLEQAALQGRAFFMVRLNQDGQLGHGPLTEGGLIGGGLSGLIKTLALEWPSVFCRLVDLGPGVDPLTPFLKEMTDPNRRLTETGWSKAGRMTLEALPERLATKSNRPIGSDQVFLVSGGAKGVTANCVIALAKASKARFILLGRSQFEAHEPAWSLGITDESALKLAALEAIKAAGEKPTPPKVNALIGPVLASREIAQTLAAIEAGGGQAVYLKADVTNPHSIRAALSGQGKVTGLIHGAGVLADRLIEKKSFADFEKVFNTKVWGLEALLEAVDPDQLNHLIVFSSSAGFYGNPGQADYSVANEILSKAALRFAKRHPKAKALAFNWGPWEGGMVTPELKKMFDARGVEVIGIEGGAKALVDELTHLEGPNQLVIGSSMTSPQPPSGPMQHYKIHKTLSLEDLPFVKDHAIAGEPVLPMVCALSWLAESAVALYPGYFVNELMDAQVLKGIVFKDASAKEFVLELEEMGKENGAIGLTAKLTSLGGKLPMLHYSARLVLSTYAPEAATIEFTGSGQSVGDGAKLYQDGTLFHGPLLRSVQSVLSINSNGLSLKATTKAPTASEMGSLAGMGILNPLADDVGLQAMLVQARHLFGNASLPLSIGEVRFHRAVSFDEPFYVTLSVQSANPGRLTADLWLHDSKGKVYTEMLDVEVTISAKLNVKFGQN